MADPTTPETTEIVEVIPPETLHGALVTYSRGQRTVHVDAKGYIKLVSALKADGYNMLIDLCGVDYLSAGHRDLPAGHVGERYEVVANLLSHSLSQRMRVRVQLGNEPTLASLYDLYPGAEAMEREAYDLLGINFEGHPDLSRILLPDDWEGHPLRKDYAMGRIPVQFKSTAQARPDRQPSASTQAH
jgi:NADH-quinone oxidoreductase subunit C